MVTDLFSISPLHYINAGETGLSHFTFLLNLLIKDSNNFALPELNKAWAIILHKKSKPIDNSRSYRCISTCPLVGKALDLWVMDNNRQGWYQVRAPTQFMHSGGSHELACILLTECIHYSLHTTHSPLYVLLVDAMSAFDVMLREHIIPAAFHAGTRGKELCYISSRLKERQTIVEYDRILLGPIND